MSRGKMTTMVDVARKAGVSTATVSHVINGTRWVSDETRRLVLEAVEQLDYRPNALARWLVTNRTNSIGILVADITNPFFAAIIRHVATGLAEKGYNLIVCDSMENIDKETGYLEMLLERRVDGLIIAPVAQTQPMLDRFVGMDIPIVFLDRRLDAPVAPFVGLDNFAAGYASTEYLLKLGHRDIAIVARDPALSTVAGRMAGFRQAMQDYGVPIDERLVEDRAFDAARDGLYRLLSHPHRPTALVATNNMITMDTLEVLLELGLRCPRDISVVSFNEEPWFRLTNPPLTTIIQPLREMAMAAVKTLLCLIEQHRLRERRRKADSPIVCQDSVLQPGLIERDSCRRLGLPAERLNGPGSPVHIIATRER